MAKQVINVGTTAGDGSGDALRDAMIKINANFTELYEGIVVQTIVGENGTTLVDISTNSVNANALTGTVPAGVVTTNPAHLMNSALEGDHVVGLALQGRVPCKVIGTVKKGDMLVTSGVPGYAMVNNSPGVGQVLGKAVGTKDTEDRGVVEIVVGRV